MPASKHIPFRQCVACRARRPKRELLRIVLTQAGPVIDPTGRRPGRGAYVCPDRPECWAEKKLRRLAGARAAELSLALQALLKDLANPDHSKGGAHGQDPNLSARQRAGDEQRGAT
ncbi:YlxR family protein [Meiothermus sp. QL-1]|uniref:YlxR family protein n=1 Tax=Meiothermus sp. QL-1 TaxID=2058095 RepID=UPI000E0AE0D7|nr:YlxR family protein [Meiothermus sp. QL-1]RDI95576.1 YlxR family protein [Meiothermus sp. QL-1]